MVGLDLICLWWSALQPYLLQSLPLSCVFRVWPFPWPLQCLSITLVTSFKSCPETNYDVLLLILCVPTLPSASHHLIPNYLHIPQHKVIWNHLYPFGLDSLTKSIFTKMKLRLNCKLQKLQGHHIEDFHHGSWPNYIESLPRQFQVISGLPKGQMMSWENTKLSQKKNVGVTPSATSTQHLVAAKGFVGATPSVTLGKHKIASKNKPKFALRQVLSPNPKTP